MTKKFNRQNQISKPQDNVVKDIVNIIDSARNNALRAVNTQLVSMYWLIGKRIDEELLTNRSNDYGKQLIKKLSQSLKKYGRGFDISNLYRALSFYLLFPNILETLSQKSCLPWSHYTQLIKIKLKEIDTKEKLLIIYEVTGN